MKFVSPIAFVLAKELEEGTSGLWFLPVLPKPLFPQLQIPAEKCKHSFQVLSAEKREACNWFEGTPETRVSSPTDTTPWCLQNGEGSKIVDEHLCSTLSSPKTVFLRNEKRKQKERTYLISLCRQSFISVKNDDCARVLTHQNENSGTQFRDVAHFPRKRFRCGCHGCCRATFSFQLDIHEVWGREKQAISNVCCNQEWKSFFTQRSDLEDAVLYCSFVRDLSTPAHTPQF